LITHLSHFNGKNARTTTQDCSFAPVTCSEYIVTGNSKVLSE